MTDIGKPATETLDKIQEHDASGQENAVGYREYIEGLDLEVSDREVSLHHFPHHRLTLETDWRFSTAESAGRST